MHKKIGLLLLIFIVLVACSNNEPDNNPTNNEEIENNRNETNNEEVSANETNEATRDVFSPGDDVFMEAEVHMSEENNQITVEGNTNLVTGSIISVTLTTTPYQFGKIIGYCSDKVDEDGTFTCKHDFKENFFIDNNERSLLVQIRLDNVMHHYEGQLKDIYGENGENLKGPLIYQKEDTKKRQVAEQEVYFIVVGGENTYTASMPEHQEPPPDYGAPEVWMEAEVVRNDHHFLYVEGKSNLLEGLELSGRYFDHKDSTKPYLAPSVGKVKPDGTFTIEVPYDDISEEGFIEISSIGPYGDIPSQYKDIYGEEFEHLSGDIVTDGLLIKQSIELIIEKKEKKNVSIPNALVTESDGELKINLPDDILFDFDKSSLKPDAKATLDEIIDLLEQMDIEENIQINGHTDNHGTMATNQPLSEERAEAVATYLKENGDLAAYNLMTFGFADTKPVASNDKEEGRQQNRRVEIIFQEK